MLLLYVLSLTGDFLYLASALRILATKTAAQQSVQPTSGILRVFQGFSWL
jgi:hypothetical protein